MKKIFIAAAIFLFVSPFVVRADVDDVRIALMDATSSVSEAESFARKACDADDLKAAKDYAKKAQDATAEALNNISTAMMNLES